MKIKTINLLVKDYSETVTFYTKKLGFQLKDNYPSYHWVTLKLPKQNDLEIALCLADKKDISLVGKQMGSHPLFIIEVLDCHAEYEKLKDRGVEFTKVPEKTDYGTFAELRDLYGNTILLRGTQGAKHI